MPKRKRIPETEWLGPAFAALLGPALDGNDPIRGYSGVGRGGLEHFKT